MTDPVRGPEDDQLQQGVEDAVEALAQMAQGNPEVRISDDAPLELLQQLNRNINRVGDEYAQAVDLAHEMAIGLAEHFDILHRVAGGDLTARARSTSSLEIIEALREVTNRTIESVGTSLDERNQARQRQRQLEEQLLHSQKMEAIGRLAGGVAHDFNNILAVITMLCELLSVELDDEHTGKDDVKEIHAACKRASNLVSQLLAFSRKQVLAPRVLDLNEAVSELEKMIRRLLGEHIEFDLVLETTPVPVRIDPTQLQQVIINLVVNAADSMPEGGHLLVQTGRKVITEGESLELKPGLHAILQVSDSHVLSACSQSASRWPSHSLRMVMMNRTLSPSPITNAT